MSRVLIKWRKMKTQCSRNQVNEVLVNETNTHSTSIRLHRLPLTFTLSFYLNDIQDINELEFSIFKFAFSNTIKNIPAT